MTEYLRTVAAKLGEAIATVELANAHQKEHDEEVDRRTT